MNIVMTVIPITKNIFLRERKISDGERLNLLAFDCYVLARQEAPTLSARI